MGLEALDSRGLLRVGMLGCLVRVHRRVIEHDEWLLGGANANAKHVQFMKDNIVKRQNVPNRVVDGKFIVSTSEGGRVNERWEDSRNNNGAFQSVSKLCVF